MKKYLFVSVAVSVLFSASVLASQFDVLDPNQNFACPVGESECSGAFPVRQPSECEIALLTSGKVAFQARVAAMLGATHSIRSQHLIWTGDEAGLVLAEIQKMKKGQGVDVRNIVDAVSNAGWQSQWMYYDLKQHGIEVEGYEAGYLHFLNEIAASDPLANRLSKGKRLLRALGLINNRYHDKILVIDGETDHAVAFLGGRNLANEYFQIGTEKAHRWRDQDVMLRGPIVQDIIAAFDRNYADFKATKNSRPDLFNTDNSWKLGRWLLDKIGGPMKIPFLRDRRKDFEVRLLAEDSVFFEPKWEPAQARFIQNRPRYGETYWRQTYLGMLATAKREVFIPDAYLVLDHVLAESVVAAVRRGVRVVLLSNSPETNDLKPLTIVARSHYASVLRVNFEPEVASMARIRGIPAMVEIREWHGGKNMGTLHAKIALKDGELVGEDELIVASYNLDERSNLNSETGVAFRPMGSNSAMTREFRNTIIYRDIPKSTLITWEQALGFENPSNVKDKAELELYKTVESQM